MNKEFSGEVFLVTGAAQGIGECIADTLAAGGATLFLSDIQKEKVADVAARLCAQGSTAKSCQVDISDPLSAQAMVAAALDAFGHIDGLVNNAALDAPAGDCWEVDEQHWRRIIDVNLSGPWWVSKAVMGHMMERRRGKIVIISSLAAREGGEHSPPIVPPKQV